MESPRSFRRSTPARHHPYGLLGAALLTVATAVRPDGPPPATAAPYHIAFNQERYAVAPGASFTAQVLLSPVPVAGLFSYGVRVRFDPAAVRVDGASAIAVTAPLAFDGPRANTPVTAVGTRFAAVKGSADFSDPARPVSTDALLASFLMTDLGGPTPYELRLEFFNTLGPTEQVFVDGAGGVLDSAITFGTALVVRPGTIEAAPLTAITLNRQSGLFEQTVRVSNRSALEIPAFRLLVRDLPATWQVWNAHGLTNGVPWLGYNTPLPAGQSVDLRVEYRIPDRNPQAQPTYVVEPALPDGEPGPPPGTPFAVVPRDQLKDGSFLLEFSSLNNRHYTVQYSRDLETWTTVQPSIAGNGSRLQWIDYGPPKTESPPSGQTNRFYRVFLLP